MAKREAGTPRQPQDPQPAVAPAPRLPTARRAPPSAAPRVPTQRPAGSMEAARPAGAGPSVTFRSQTGGFASPPAQRQDLPLLDERDADAAEHRQFPRALLEVRVEAWMEDAVGARLFSASFLTENLSVSGAFLASTFFLPVGTELRVRFDLERGEGPVEARARIVREERDERRSGFGIRFEEFYGQSEVTLAKLFLVAQLRSFATEYLRSPRAGAITGELDRLVDALAGWELLKVANPRDTWRGG